MPSSAGREILRSGGRPSQAQSVRHRRSRSVGEMRVRSRSRNLKAQRTRASAVLPGPRVVLAIGVSIAASVRRYYGNIICIVKYAVVTVGTMETRRTKVPGRIWNLRLAPRDRDLLF